jgi:hypothetical protein
MEAGVIEAVQRFPLATRRLVESLVLVDRDAPRRGLTQRPKLAS